MLFTIAFLGLLCWRTISKIVITFGTQYKKTVPLLLLLETHQDIFMMKKI